MTLPAPTTGRGRHVLVNPTGRSHVTQTYPPIGSAALPGQQALHRSVKHGVATLIVVALFAGVSATAANAGADPTLSLRDRVDAIGNRFFAAQKTARELDAQMRVLDDQLTATRRRAETLHPAAKAAAVQLYQTSAQPFTVLFDAADAMESARHAELLARAGERTQALLDQYMNAADTLKRQRAEVGRARTKQAKVVADLAEQRSALEQSLAQIQRTYQEQLAAKARAVGSRAQSTAGTAAPAGPPTTTPPPPPAPVPVPAPPPPEAGTNPHHNDAFLVCTRERESAGDYQAVNLGGYYGAYQFSQPTWDVTASHAGMPQLIGVRPDAASPWDQDQLAWVLYQWQGSGPWGGLC